MNFRHFELRITGKEDQDGYVRLFHGSVYSLSMYNNHYSRRCQAKLLIDGKEIGTFVINPRQSIYLEGPPRSGKRFTLYKYGTLEAKKAQLEDSDNLGLVQVLFTLEADSTAYISRSAGLKGGGTGLSGYSSQCFEEVDDFNLDHSTSTMIALRLMPSHLDEIESLTNVMYSTPIPPKL